MIRKRATELDNEYYSWLCELINVEHGRTSYWNLTQALYMKDFHWSVPNDDNRAFEGKNLREKFCDEIGIDYVVDRFPDDVSMLELIIGLAYRCERIMEDSEYGRPMAEWFWKLLENAGLYKFDDDHFDTMDDSEVDYILEVIIGRTYKRDGRGGLFPLKIEKKDQRKVELWYQMNAYLVENYYTDQFGA